MNLAKKLRVVTAGYSGGYVGDVFSTYVYKEVTS